MRKGKFRVGDIAVLSHPKSRRDLTGVEVEIIKQEDTYTDKKGNPVYAYGVQVCNTLEVLAASEDSLSKLDPANAVVSWEDCAWQPKRE